MNEEIPIAEYMRIKRQCQQCSGWARCVYVKVTRRVRRGTSHEFCRSDSIKELGNLSECVKAIRDAFVY